MSLTNDSYQRSDLHTGGFSLIEAIVYLALLSILLTSSVASAYALAEAAGRTRSLARAEQEGMFLLRSMRWSLQEGSVVEPRASQASDRLIVIDDSGAVRAFYGKDGSMVIDDRDGIRQLSGYGLSNLSVIRSGLSGGLLDPERIDISFTLLVPVSGATRERSFHKTFYPNVP
ncbi:MAG: prepilin-type N-terminal cleavage/methylation domain-containing protein [Patescibacteria group bacterium]